MAWTNELTEGEGSGMRPGLEPHSVYTTGKSLVISECHLSSLSQASVSIYQAFCVTAWFRVIQGKMRSVQLNCQREEFEHYFWDGAAAESLHRATILWWQRFYMLCYCPHSRQSVGGSRMELTHDTGPQSWNECCRVTWDLHFSIFYTAHLIGEDTHAGLDMRKR